MINYKQFRELILVPTLDELAEEFPGCNTEEAIDILSMIAAHESKGGTYLSQYPEGPARGIYQMEPVAFNEVDRYVQRKKHTKIDATIDRSVYDHRFSSFCARVYLWRIHEPLPKKGDENYLNDLAYYCKKYWNTSAGKATGEDYYNAFKEWCQ